MMQLLDDAIIVHCEFSDYDCPDEPKEIKITS
jgi:hypothetical protein